MVVVEMAMEVVAGAEVSTAGATEVAADAVIDVTAGTVTPAPVTTAEVAGSVPPIASDAMTLGASSVLLLPCIPV